MKRKNSNLPIIKNLLFLFFSFVFTNNVFTHVGDVHKYIVWNAWELVKDQRNVNYTAMNSRIGPWWLGWYNDGDWYRGYVVTGAFREDESDVMYGYNTLGTVTSTHFWDPEDFTCDSDPYNTKFKPWDYCYENSLVKAKNYWRGKKFANDDWLAIRVGVLSGPNISPNIYTLILRYDDLGDVYKNNQIYVTGAVLSFPFYIPYNPPRPLMDFTLQGGTRGRIENICWEIVGRICHLLGDAGVPAHAHNDPHPPMIWGGEDFFEYHMSINYNQYCYSWQFAKEQANFYYQPVFPELYNNTTDPLRDIFYMTNQLADRLPDNDENGDGTYQHFGPGNENYEYWIQPIMNNMHSHHHAPFNADNLADAGGKLFPFSLRTTAGFLWYVYNKFGIQSDPPPVISSLAQSPPILCPNSSTYITCNLSQGGVISYQWIPLNMPSNITITPLGDGKVVRVTKTSSMNAGGNPDNPPVPIFGLICVASNIYGWDRDTIEVNHATTCNGGGCPWIYVYNSDNSAFDQDNNILHRSEFSDNIGVNINDFYKLQVQPTFVNNNCSIVIHETENDTNYYNSIKLYAVDHPTGTIIGVTENNDIVMYDNNSVTSTDNASLNNYRDITGLIQYNYNGNKIVSGDNGDNIYAHYDSSSQMKIFEDHKIKFGKFLSGSSSDSLALIGEVGENDAIIHGIVAKDYAGQVNIYTNDDNYTKLFARRESNSTIIIPFAQNVDAVDYIDINWYRDYQVSYFSVVPILYSGFDVTEMPLVEANHSTNGDCIVDLLIQDSVFVKLDSSSTLNLKFENIQGPATNMIRDYVIYVEGRYTNIITSGQNKALNINNNIINNQNPLEYKLYSNYPNPFNPKTLIKYDIAKNGFVKIVIYDLLGRVVKELVNNFKSAGTYSVEFDGTNLASGVYIYRMESGNFADNKKMVLIK
jgi:hypothetical protein